MVWLAEGSEPTLQQLILSHRKPHGGWQGTHFSGGMRGRGQGEGLRAEGGLYNSRSCHRPTRVLKQFEAVACTSELFEAHAHTLYYQSSALWKTIDWGKKRYHIADSNMKGNSRK